MACQIPVISRVEKLLNLEGEQFNHIWIQLMIDHHLDTIRLGQHYLGRTSPDLAILIRDMIRKKTEEVDVMQQWLQDFTRSAECIPTPTDDMQFATIMSTHLHTGNIMCILALQNRSLAHIGMMAQRIIDDNRRQIQLMKDLI